MTKYTASIRNAWRILEKPAERPTISESSLLEYLFDLGLSSNISRSYKATINMSMTITTASGMTPAQVNAHIQGIVDKGPNPLHVPRKLAERTALIDAHSA